MDACRITPAGERRSVTSKAKAEEYFNRISDGHKHAIKRPWDSNTDRCLRAMIEKANKNGDCIINVGDGIYRPIPGDPVDEKEYREYLAKDRSRAKEILLKVSCMEQTFEGWKNEALYANHQR